MNSLTQEKIIKAVVAIISLIITLGLIFLGVLAFKSALIGFGIVCFMLVAILGYFLYVDYLYFFKKQTL